MEVRTAGKPMNICQNSVINDLRRRGIWLVIMNNKTADTLIVVTTRSTGQEIRIRHMLPERCEDKKSDTGNSNRKNTA